MSTNLRFNFMSVCILIVKFTILISAVAKNGSFAFAEGSACAAGAKANVPFVRLAFLFVFVLVVGRPTLACNLLIHATNLLQ